MKISQQLYDKLIEKNFYKFLCGNALFDCFIQYGEKIREIIDLDRLLEVLNKYKIFRYASDTIDYEIYRLFHIEWHNDFSDNGYLVLNKPTIYDNNTLWLEQDKNIFGCLPNADAIIEANVVWNANTSISN